MSYNFSRGRSSGNNRYYETTQYMVEIFVCLVSYIFSFCKPDGFVKKDDVTCDAVGLSKF